MRSYGKKLENHSVLKNRAKSGALHLQRQTGKNPPNQQRNKER